MSITCRAGGHDEWFACDPSDRSHRCTAAVGGDARAVSFDTWIDGCAADDPGHVGGPDEVSMQLYTSGTTGLPRG